MKDALGHGSNPGTHSTGIVKLPKKLNRAHFEQIAENLRSSGADDAKIASMAAQLATTNPGFNRERFIAAVKGDSKGQGLKSRASSRANAAKRAHSVYSRLGG
jgi:hypothetical protein